MALDIFTPVELIQIQQDPRFAIPDGFWSGVNPTGQTLGVFNQQITFETQNESELQQFQGKELTVIETSNYVFGQHPSDGSGSGPTFVRGGWAPTLLGLTEYLRILVNEQIEQHRIDQMKRDGGVPNE